MPGPVLDSGYRNRTQIRSCSHGLDVLDGEKIYESVEKIMPGSNGCYGGNKIRWGNTREPGGSQQGRHL